MPATNHFYLKLLSTREWHWSLKDLISLINLSEELLDEFDKISKWKVDRSKISNRRKEVELKI